MASFYFIQKEVSNENKSNYEAKLLTFDQNNVTFKLQIKHKLVTNETF